ncbi:MAG: hypothetical protein ACRENO_09625 [Thermodesulfobacteriota bacterium]
MDNKKTERSYIENFFERLLLNISIRLNEFLTYYKAFFKPPVNGKNNFIIFSSNRTGSTLLNMLLKSHSEIDCQGEIFLKFKESAFKKVLFPYLYIRGIKSENHNTFGFVLKTQHIDVVFSDKHKDLVSNLYHKGWKIIYLKRLNIFRQAVSHLIAMTNKQWHDFPEKPIKREKVYIDCKKLLPIINWFEKLAEIEEEILNNFKYKLVFYENSLLEENNHQKTCEDIFDFLGISAELVTTEIKKISTGSLEDQIINYEEVVNFFSKTKYSEFL